jgi:hypothetical protein
MARRAALREKHTTASDIERCRGKIERPGRAECAVESNMNELEVRRSDLALHRIDKRIQNGLSCRRIVSAEALRDYPGIVEKPRGFGVFVLRNQLPMNIYSLAIFFNGNTYDARQALCGVFLGCSGAAANGEKKGGGQTGLKT